MFVFFCYYSFSFSPFSLQLSFLLFFSLFPLFLSILFPFLSFFFRSDCSLDKCFLILNSSSQFYFETFLARLLRLLSFSLAVKIISLGFFIFFLFRVFFFFSSVFFIYLVLFSNYSYFTASDLEHTESAAAL